MEYLKYAAIILLSITELIILGYALKSGKPLKNLLLNALLGIAALIVVNITTRFSGVHIALNEWTAGGAAAFGIPAVCGFLLLQIIFGS